MQASEFLCVPKRYRQNVEIYRCKFPNAFFLFELSNDQTKLLLKGLPGSGFEMFISLSEISSVKYTEKEKPIRHRVPIRYSADVWWEGGAWEIEITLKNQEKFRWLYYRLPCEKHVKDPVAWFEIGLNSAIGNAKYPMSDKLAIVFSAFCGIIFLLLSAVSFLEGNTGWGVFWLGFSAFLAVGAAAIYWKF